MPAASIRATPSPGRAATAAVARNLALAALVGAATALGAFAPFDRFIGDQRFSLSTGPISQKIATVEIDSRSLNQVGVWPWPRTLHGEMVDRLVALGARRILFDVDFSAESAPENDRAFAAALARAKGKVWLAEFQQPGGVNGGATVDAPIPLLARNAGVVSIDVPLAPDGFVREYSTALDIGGSLLPTAGAWLAHSADVAPRSFGIDYGLDLDAMSRVSVADLLAGRAPRAAIEGRDVIIGASAEELRDVFMTPRYGLLPGLAVHALAAETMLARRELQPTPTIAVVTVMAALALFAAALESLGFVSLVGLGLAGVLVEAAALALHKWAALMTATAGLQIALAAFAIGHLVSALLLRRRLHAEAARERDITRAMLAQVIDDNFDGVVVSDDRGKILNASLPAREWLDRDLSGAAVSALPPALASAVATALASADGVNAGEAQLDARDGAARHLDYVVTASNVPEAPERRVVCLTFRDVTERRAQVARLEYLARHDEMTGAWTRGELLENLGARLASDASGLTLFCVTLRRFDLVNDVFGHRVGDRLLVAVAQRVRELGFPFVARLGGARFAFGARDAAYLDALTARGAELVRKLVRPYLVDGHPVIVGASLGATTSAISGLDPEVLLTHASMAQEQAARRVGDVFAVFSPDMETRRREKQALDAALRRSVADGSLSLQYQPKVALPGGSLIGAEALMRWRNPEGANVSPVLFIPVAEESGLIVELGRFALRVACAEAMRWPPHTIVAVNVSPVQFGLSDVYADVQRALTDAGLPPQRLEIEITESAFVDGDASISLGLDRLRALGVKIALDDFGTGYSSLHYLGRLPIDTIKIDQSFVRAMTREPSAAATVRAIVALAKAHGKFLVAEGVETAEDAALLAEMGCEYGQGYHFDRPLDAAAFLARTNTAQAAA